MRIEAKLGDITLAQVDAVVNAANEALAGGGGLAPAAGQGPGPADAAALAFAHAAPDAELLAIGEGVLEALEADDAAPAHLLGLPGRRAPFREEEVGVDAQAVGLVLPAAVECVHLPHQSLHRSGLPSCRLLPPM